MLFRSNDTATTEIYTSPHTLSLHDALPIAAFQIDILTAYSAAAQALANVGPGLGPIIGPSGNYSSLPDGVKWLLAFGMMIGRLELMTVLVLFTPTFWRG